MRVPPSKDTLLSRTFPVRFLELKFNSWERYCVQEVSVIYTIGGTFCRKKLALSFQVVLREPSHCFWWNQIKGCSLRLRKARRRSKLKECFKNRDKSGSPQSPVWLWGVSVRRSPVPACTLVMSQATSLQNYSQIQRRSRAASLPMKPFYLLLRRLEGVASSSEPSGLDREEFGQNKATGDTGASRDTRRPKTKENFWVCSLHPAPPHSSNFFPKKHFVCSEYPGFVGTAYLHPLLICGISPKPPRTDLWFVSAQAGSFS